MTTIKIKKGSGTPSGLTFGELAYDVTNKRLFIGITGGNALLANTDGGVASFNGLTGAVSGVTVGGTNVFTALNTFNAGISASSLIVVGGATFSGSVSAGTITATLNGNASTATTLQTTRAINETSFNGSSNITINQVYREDNRIISPSEGSTGYSRFAFTSWNNNNTSPYADAIHFRTYLDASGGSDNLLMLRKTSGIGMRLWQQTYGSTLAYSVYKDVAFIQDSVASFNGITGAVTGVTVGGTNVFTALNTFNAGISAAGGITFSGTVSSDTGYRISSSALNTQTGTTYTFSAADNGEIVTFNNGSTITVTVPTGLPVGFNCTSIQLGAGQVGFTAASGVTLNAYASGFKIAGQHGSAALISYASNVYNLSGTLTI
jgi:hypothetical protein